MTFYWSAAKLELSSSVSEVALRDWILKLWQRRAFSLLTGLGLHPLLHCAFRSFFYFPLPFSVLMIETYVKKSKKKFPERQKTKVSRGTAARSNWDLTSPFTHWSPLSLFYSAHGFLDSSSDTVSHKHRCTNRKTEKSKASSSPVDTGTLRQLLWMAEKQWSTFRPPVKRRCQAAGAGGCYHLHSASPLTRQERVCVSREPRTSKLYASIYTYI